MRPITADSRASAQRPCALCPTDTLLPAPDPFGRGLQRPASSLASVGPYSLAGRSAGRLQQAALGSARSVKHVTLRQRTTVKAVYQPFPFDEAEYHKAHLTLVQASEPMGRPEGSIVFMKEGETLYDKDKEALVLSVGGDTLNAIANQIQRRDSDRPMALDLLMKLLSRGQDISKRDWRLVRVAIVDLRNNVYYGRLFFGDSEERIVWDCDCRPSDACWLSLKVGAPIYVNKEVWEANSVPVVDLMSSQEAGAAVTAGGRGGSAGEGEEQQETGNALLTKIRKDDPDPIKRLKREMEVALLEEDYATAARIRDHPFMQLHVNIVRMHKEGNLQAAAQLEEELTRAIQESEASRGMS